jgi:hypothetical protein
MLSRTLIPNMQKKSLKHCFLGLKFKKPFLAQVPIYEQVQLTKKSLFF